MKRLWFLLLNFTTFFIVIGFVVTCSFLVFSNTVELSENEVRAYAPTVFFNTLLLSALFTIGDALRRRITIDRPVRKIKDGLERIKNGEFDTKISFYNLHNRENRFDDIVESINLLAEELASVETLRTDFIANVSHELKTPLAAMQNYGTLLQAPDLTDEKRLEYAKGITDNSRKLSTLITNILKLNRLENQQIFPQKKRFDLGEQLCECLIHFEHTWEQLNINIETDFDEGVFVYGDRELLSLVWNNLFSNAFKFTDPGGTVSVSLQADERNATVSVQDTGCGMSPEIGAHIFEKFYQGDTSHATQGNGLGLALVKRIIDILNGEITVSSTLGVGSTFTVRLRRDPI